MVTNRQAPLTQLTLLLSWVNRPMNIYASRATDVARWEREGRYAIARFLRSFDGSSSARHLVYVRRRRDLPSWMRADMARERALDPEALQTLHVELRMLIEHGVGESETLALPTPSLAFGVRRDGSTYVFNVSGRVHDVVLFFVMHLLTTGRANIRYCIAPAARDWQTLCGKSFVQQPQGRPKLYCSHRCGVRVVAKKKAETLKAERRMRKDAV